MPDTLVAPTPPATPTPATAGVRDGPGQDLPGSFLRLPVEFPHAFGDALGYSGDERFVGFWLTGWPCELAVYDGQTLSIGDYDPHTFTSVVVPSARRHGANLGSRPVGPTHLFVWDRRRDAGYLAPVASARAFLKARAACVQAATVPAIAPSGG